MKKVSFITVVVVIFSLFSIKGYSQKDTIKSVFNVGCDLMSRYVWRGTDFGSSPSIQPTIEFSKGGFTIGSWGAFTTNLPGVQEADLYMSYTAADMVSVTFTDYFFPDETAANNRYFNYKSGETGHVFEISASFNGTKKLPLNFTIAANIYGADAVKNDENGVATEDIQFSTYAEIGYSFKYLDMFAGFNILAPDLDRGESGYYGNYTGFVNLGITHTKNIKITENFTLPLSVSLIFNPQTEKIFMVAGFSF